MNFQFVKNTENDNSTYACSDNCDYVYIVLKCGRVFQIEKCPWCGADCGGTGYDKMVQRPGHRRMNDAEAIKYIAALVAKYNNTQKTGYFNFNTPS